MFLHGKILIALRSNVSQKAFSFSLKGKKMFCSKDTVIHHVIHRWDTLTVLCTLCSYNPHRWKHLIWKKTIGCEAEKDSFTIKPIFYKVIWSNYIWNWNRKRPLNTVFSSSPWILALREEGSKNHMHTEKSQILKCFKPKFDSWR